jgi:hypothetical protein
VGFRQVVTIEDVVGDVVVQSAGRWERDVIGGGRV